MGFSLRSLSVVALTALLIGACGDDETNNNTGTGALSGAQPVVEQYAKNVHASYTESLTAAKAMKTAIDAFLASPSTGTLDTAKVAWIAARKPYGPTEVFRFYGGPIDNEENGPEGALNAWPLDENYIDYTKDDPTAGIIAKTDITLDKDTLRSKNEEGGEKNIATGYHAIEFLLWGQDNDEPSLGSAGKRSFKDFVVGDAAAKNQDRRRQYLQLVTDMLIEDLESLVAAWEPNKDNYAKTFVADSKGAITKMLTGMGSMANAELSGERMTVAYKNRGQEDEHSCFSDNTDADLLGNFVGISNVYYGKNGSTDGPGIDDLVKAADPALHTKFDGELSAALTALNAMQSTPFDKAIDAADGSPERDRVLTAIKAIQACAATIEAIGAKLGVTFQLEQPSETL